MLLPPAPFDELELSYPSSTSAGNGHSLAFPQPPAVPPSAELFSSAETDHLFDFLDVFGGWELDQLAADGITNEFVQPSETYGSVRHAPYHNPHLEAPTMMPQASYRHQHQQQHQSGGVDTRREPEHHRPASSTSGSIVTARRTSPSASSSSSSSTRKKSNANANPSAAHSSASPSGPPATPIIPQASNQPPRARQLLSSPQKRLNHIMSEQKRRNTIRDGYAQLIALLAPDGAPAIDMPTRGRPKGSGGRSKGGSKGKSGVLFRTVEYIKFLEENMHALREEVFRVEQAAGIRSLV